MTGELQFVNELQRELNAAHADMRRAIHRQLVPAGLWPPPPPSRRTRARRRVRAWRRWVTGLRIAHKDRIDVDW